jgi:hypothetical protein
MLIEQKALPYQQRAKCLENQDDEYECAEYVQLVRPDALRGVERQGVDTVGGFSHDYSSPELPLPQSSIQLCIQDGAAPSCRPR